MELPVGKVLWHITMSLDGFIASPGDDMAWLADHLGPNPTADEVLAQIGALLIGHHTYQLAKTEEDKPYGGAWTVHVRADPRRAGDRRCRLHLCQRRHRGGRRHRQGRRWRQVRGHPWCQTAQQCLDAGVLDEVLVHIAPVLLGDGVRLFDRPGGTNVKLERISLTDSPQVTNLWFRVVK